MFTLYGQGCSPKQTGTVRSTPIYHRKHLGTVGHRFPPAPGNRQDLWASPRASCLATGEERAPQPSPAPGFPRDSGCEWGRRQAEVPARGWGDGKRFQNNFDGTLVIQSKVWVSESQWPWRTIIKAECFCALLSGLLISHPPRPPTNAEHH